MWGDGGAGQLCLNYQAAFPGVEVPSGEASVVLGKGLRSGGPSALTHSTAAATFCLSACVCAVHEVKRLITIAGALAGRALYGVRSLGAIVQPGHNRFVFVGGGSVAAFATKTLT